MLLFLDIISPLPEIFIIEENKVIFHRKIITNESLKLSDHIFETYLKINDDLDLTRNLEEISMTIGPGSYTSLRVGASFALGLKVSQSLKFYPLSISDMYKFKCVEKETNKIGFYISSANKQNFFCKKNDQNKIEYIKLEDNKPFMINNIDKIFYNSKKLNLNKKNISQYKFSFVDEFLLNKESLNFKIDKIIQPIYISNNKILN